MTDMGSILGDVLKHYTGVPQSPEDVRDVPHNEVYNHYQQFTQQASPQQVSQASQQAFERLPPDQKEGVFTALVSALVKHGVNLQQAGVQGNNPTPQNFSQVVQYLGQNPNLLDAVLGQKGSLNSPVAKLVMAAVMAVAANKLTGKL